MSKLRKFGISLGIGVTLLVGCYVYTTTPHHTFAPPESAEGLLDRADTLAWGNEWAEAEPLYRRAQNAFLAQNDPARALYAEVSQAIPNESESMPAKILRLSEDLQRPEAQDPETRLRILTIRGMLETNYDASKAQTDWAEVRSLALKLRHVQLATRAEGEEGIAAFLLGNVDAAKRLVVRAWTLSKVERDPAATVRYASMFGTGLVEIQRYKEALTALDQAIKVATTTPGVAYPTIAIYAKIDALTGLHRYDEALSLANQSLARVEGTPYQAHKSDVLLSRGSIYSKQGTLNPAIQDYVQAIQICKSIDNYRCLTNAGGLLARVYEQVNDLPAALGAINTSIEANTHISDELYLVPRNLAIKAEIMARLGHVEESNALYRASIALVDVMLQHAATVNIQRQLLTEMSDVYSGYFASLCTQKQYNEALNTLEKGRGRVEAEALQHHSSQTVHLETAGEKELTRLNIALVNADNAQQRQFLTDAIYSTELRTGPSSLAQQSIANPVHLAKLQHDLPAHTLLIEYVLAEPNSYALAVTNRSVVPYTLPARSQVEADANRYRKEIRTQKPDPQLAHQLFTELMGPITEYDKNTDLVIVADGALHLLPFSALGDKNAYVLQTHTLDVQPSSTVFDLLTTRSATRPASTMPYVGIAAWTKAADTRNPIVRAISGPQRSQLVALPDSQKEVETIAADLPKPSTILLGDQATEAHFKALPLGSTDVIHLALHGYADLDYPDRSALIFAPEQQSTQEDGLLQVREIRQLHLNSRMVTLSACNTGVGPVGQGGIANIVNAFIEAGADTVVSTLWELEDHATEHLMTQFYSHLATHERKTDALRAAQLELLNQGLPPYYWASFQIVGDPNGRF